MAPTAEIFRFVTLRPANRVLMNRIESRLIRDRRKAPPMLTQLYGPGDYEPKLASADTFARSADFLEPDHAAMAALDQVVDFFRRELEPGRPLTELAAEFRQRFPMLAALLERTPPAQLVEQTNAALGRLWDCLYALVTIGTDRFVSTNYIVDGLRVYHVLRLLWLSGTLGLDRWNGGRLTDYHPIIDLQAAARGAAKAAEKAAAAATSTGGPSVRVELSVGELKPPTVGDLLLVEQKLLRYEPGEVADLETVMRGERRERTTRNLSRTSQTTTTESSTETEESSSLTTDERFQLAVQSQTTATESFGVEAGVSVSGKFGPVQVGATASASYDTSETSTDTTSQEYAKSVTEEATKRVSNSIKQTSSLTILTETQETTLQGFNNEDGTEHINGVYVWLDKIYQARLLNYGRRLMLSLAVPEPGGYHRGLMQQNEAEVLADLVEPAHPSTLGYASFQDIEETNYAELAARYDVTGLEPPMPESLTGSKAFSMPETRQAAEMDDDGLSLVLADNSLTIDPDYRLTQVAVYAPAGPNDSHRQYADAMRMGEKKDETDRILVTVGHRDFWFNVTGQGNNDPKNIETNFNGTVDLHPGDLFTEKVEPTLPVTISASFSGLLNLVVVYGAARRQEALDRWRADTYAAILKGYAVQKQAYDQALAVAQATVASDVVAQTFQLREDQYRAIEQTELKRGCIELLTEGSATGPTPVTVAADGTPRIIFDGTDPNAPGNWRSPLAHGTVAEFFELAFAWTQMTYRFHPYYWAGKTRWPETASASAADPIFESFLRAGSASVTVPVEPGFERAVLLFLRTARVWVGQYLPLFTSQDMLDMHADVERGVQLDPPVQVGEPWTVRLPTTLVMLQQGDELPEFPADDATPPPPVEEEPVPDDETPF